MYGEEDEEENYNATDAQPAMMRYGSDPELREVPVSKVISNDSISTPDTIHSSRLHCST